VKPERPDWMDENTYLSLPDHLEIRDLDPCSSSQAAIFLD